MGGGLVLVLLATGSVWVWPSSRVASHPGQAQGPRIHSSPPPVPTGRGRTSFPVLVVNGHYRPTRNPSACPYEKALPAGYEATAQLRHLTLSGTSIRRKRHESVMAVALNSEQEMSQNALASKHTHAPEPRAISSAGIPSGSFGQFRTDRPKVI
jgi:hypothetical protein